MKSEELKELISFGREQLGVEFKGPGSRDDRKFFALIAKAMIGMANRRDGGKIIIGVCEDTNKKLIPDGLSKKQLATWKYDDIANSIDEYADPSLHFELSQPTFMDNQFVVIEVNEFEDIPILCKKTYDDTLRKGACYVRPRRKPETTEIPSQSDMRDLLSLAVEKGLRKFLAQASKAGLIPPERQFRDDTDEFNLQVQDFLGKL